MSDSNVIDLSTYQKQKKFKSHTISYVSENIQWLGLLASIQTLGIEKIQNKYELQLSLNKGETDLILVESNIHWADPLEIAQTFHCKLEIPVVLLCDDKEKCPTFIKKAYACGISDTLYAPICRDELIETLDVLLKFQRRLSLFH